MRVTFGLILLVGLIEVYALYDDFGGGPYPIEKTLECRVPRSRGSLFVNERRIKLPLIPSAQNVLWRPPNPNVPLYSGDSLRRYTDASLQSILNDFNAADNATTPAGLLSVSFDPVGTPTNELGPCQQKALSDAVMGNFQANASVMTLIDRYIMDLDCQPNFLWNNESAYFYPPYFGTSKCLNNIDNQATCSYPRGAQCAMNTTSACELEINMLRWDCCWTWDVAALEYFYDCGWRRVTVPMYTDCICVCDRQTTLDLEVIPLILNR